MHPNSHQPRHSQAVRLSSVMFLDQSYIKGGVGPETVSWSCNCLQKLLQEPWIHEVLVQHLKGGAWSLDASRLAWPAHKRVVCRTSAQLPESPAPAPIPSPFAWRFVSFCLGPTWRPGFPVPPLAFCSAEGLSSPSALLGLYPGFCLLPT